MLLLVVVERLAFNRDRYLDRHETQPHYLLDVMGLSDTIYGTKAKKINILLDFFSEVKYYLSERKGVVFVDEKTKRLILIVVVIVFVLFVLTQVLPFLPGKLEVIFFFLNIGILLICIAGTHFRMLLSKNLPLH